MMRIAALLVCAASLALAASPARDVTFLSTSDSHYREPDHKAGCHNDLNRATVEEMNRIAGVSWPAQLGSDKIAKPRGVVILGDLIDDGDRAENGRLISAEQCKFFRSDFGLDGSDGLLKYPIFEGWGNHDGPPIGKEKNGFSSQGEIKKRNLVRKEKKLISNVSENGLHYSWDWDDVHFVQLNLYPADKQREGVKYSPLWHDPQGALAFLKSDLAQKVGSSGRPVVLMSHCGFDTDWWTPADWKDLYEAAKDFNVVLYLYGHSGTGLREWAPDGETKKWICINDGQTNVGFFVIQITGDRVRAAYRLKSGLKFTKAPDGRQVHEWNGAWDWKFPMEKKLAAGKEMRVWHFSPFKEPMQDWPREVRGGFVELRCEDNPFSQAALILVRDDFRLRSYPAKSLAAEDRALAEKLEAERVAAKPKQAQGRPYAPLLKHYTQDTANITESDHFTFYYGNDRAGSGKAMFEEAGFLPRQKRWFENVWTNLGALGAPLPMAADPAPHKINVFITGSGLEKHREGFAFGAEGIVIHPHALGVGSSVVPHEFTHTIQYYSKGFRDSPFVGWFWECHANWSTHQFMPGYPPVLAHYAGRAHYELNSSRHNYGSWPFLQTLAENPRFGPEFPYAIWPACKRNNTDGALEDPFQVIQRLGVERGVWKNGVEGFGDAIGELAARMVAWDFQNQFFYQQEIRNMVRHSPGVPSHRTVLEPVSDRPGWWNPIYSHAPRQYGVNIIELMPEAERVTAEFSGIVDEVEGSDWRVTLVAYDALGRARYSPTVHGGKLTLDVSPGEKLALAIAAAPTRYTPLAFRPGYNKKCRYPYEVAFSGAKPAAAPPLREEPKTEGAQHANGGGFVAKSAKVAPTVYVGPNACVLDRAEVAGNARIEDFAVVRQNARVGDDAIVGGFARITDHARVADHARVRGFARLGGKAVLAGNARLLEYATVDGNGMVTGDVLVKGFGEVHLQPATEVTGGTIFGEDLEVHFADCALPKVNGGMFYGYVNADILKKETGDNRWLYAHWDFNEPRQAVLKDANADCNGVLRGNPVFSKVMGRDCLRLDGKSYALVEGHVIDARNIAFDLQLEWSGGPDDQRVFEFGDADNSLFLAIQKGGHPTFVIHRGATAATLQSAMPVPAGRFTRLTVTLQDSVARIFIDGRLAAENTSFPFSPEDVRARTGRIGAGLAGPGFIGALDDLAVYRTGSADVLVRPSP